MVKEKVSGLLEKIKAGGVTGNVNTLLAYLALSRFANIPSEVGERQLQREAIQSQKDMITPESLYYQAALPQAQAEEEQARQALMSTMSGGVLGPSLPRGYRVIGGGGG